MSQIDDVDDAYASSFTFVIDNMQPIAKSLEELIDLLKSVVEEGNGDAASNIVSELEFEDDFTAMSVDSSPYSMSSSNLGSGAGRGVAVSRGSSGK